MSNIYFISDLHIGHQGIMKFGQRDFKTIEEHDEAVVDSWNSVVLSKRDLVWVLGDICMDISKMWLFHKMNGHKRLVMGNHDRFDSQVYLKYFDKIVGIEKRYGLVMTHVPIHPQELSHNWKYNVHGHIHHPERNIKDKRYLNINVDNVGMCPLHIDQVRERLGIKHD